MTDTTHLSEAERQGAADGTLDADRARAVARHIAECSDCAADVARLKSLITRARTAPDPSDSAIAELWPTIRSRIEQSKVVELQTSRPPEVPRSLRRTWMAIAGAAAAAGFLMFAYFGARPDGNGKREALSSSPDTGVSLISVADSSRAYEEEAHTLLNGLEMQRSMLRPSTAASFERDLQVIDKSIAELKEAIANDPNNPALRRLLAASYRQKVDLLKRAHNAG
jgi:hypothetical protein